MHPRTLFDAGEIVFGRCPGDAVVPSAINYRTTIVGLVGVLRADGETGDRGVAHIVRVGVPHDALQFNLVKKFHIT